MKVDIIIIKGCPASGKSQTAKKLSQSFPKGVRLEVDTLRQMVISVEWTNQQEHINILQLSTGLVLDFLKSGYKPVIVVDTFSGNKINRYLDTLYQSKNNLRIKIFGLFTNDEELRKRLELRKAEEFRDFAICKKLNDDVKIFKHDTEFQIDTTELSVSQTASIISRQILEDEYLSR